MLACLERRQRPLKMMRGGGVRKTYKEVKEQIDCTNTGGLTRHVTEWGAEETCQGVKKRVEVKKTTGEVKKKQWAKYY